MDIAERHGLGVVEDAAQAIGAEYQGKKAGALGDVGCLSFFPSKNLGGAGDGGMVITNNEEIAEKARLLREHGSHPKYFHSLVGVNSRLDALQAAVLLVKLKFLDGWNEARRANAAYYNERLGSLQGVTVPFVDSKCVHIYHQYVIRAANRDALFEYLKEKGIGVALYYPLPLHLQECFAYLGQTLGDLPLSERAAKEVIALPIFPELTKEEMDIICDEISSFLEKGN
jgi:dTDP-4-amino-4,6-dideoxygalactose transaminase